MIKNARLRAFSQNVFTRFLQMDDHCWTEVARRLSVADLSSFLRCCQHWALFLPSAFWYDRVKALGEEVGINLAEREFLQDNPCACNFFIVVYRIRLSMMARLQFMCENNSDCTQAINLPQDLSIIPIEQLLWYYVKGLEHITIPNVREQITVTIAKLDFVLELQELVPEGTTASNIATGPKDIMEEKTRLCQTMDRLLENPPSLFQHETFGLDKTIAVVQDLRNVNTPMTVVRVWQQHFDTET